jgi:hypothetical protein
MCNCGACDFKAKLDKLFKRGKKNERLEDKVQDADSERSDGDDEQSPTVEKTVPVKPE